MWQKVGCRACQGTGTQISNFMYGEYEFYPCDVCNCTGEVSHPWFWFRKFGTYRIKLLPWFGSDEFDRCTIVLPFLSAALIIAIPPRIHQCDFDEF